MCSTTTESFDSVELCVRMAPTPPPWNAPIVQDAKQDIVPKKIKSIERKSHRPLLVSPSAFRKGDARTLCSERLWSTYPNTVVQVNFWYATVEKSNSSASDINIEKNQSCLWGGLKLHMHRWPSGATQPFQRLIRSKITVWKSSKLGLRSKMRGLCQTWNSTRETRRIKIKSDFFDFRKLMWYVFTNGGTSFRKVLTDSVDKIKV